MSLGISDFSFSLIPFDEWLTILVSHSYLLRDERKGRESAYVMCRKKRGRDDSDSNGIGPQAKTFLIWFEWLFESFKWFDYGWKFIDCWKEEVSTCLSYWHFGNRGNALSILSLRHSNVVCFIRHGLLLRKSILAIRATWALLFLCCLPWSQG